MQCPAHSRCSKNSYLMSVHIVILSQKWDYSVAFPNSHPIQQTLDIPFRFSRKTPQNAGF